MEGHRVDLQQRQAVRRRGDPARQTRSGLLHFPRRRTERKGHQVVEVIGIGDLGNAARSRLINVPMLKGPLPLQDSV